MFDPKLILLPLKFLFSQNCAYPLLEKGILQNRFSESIVIYFPGHAQQDDWEHSDPGAYGGRLNKNYWIPWAQYIIGEGNYHIEKHLESLKLSSFVLGSSHLCLSNEDLTSLLEMTGASNLIFASHSGSYLGLNLTLKSISSENSVKIKRIAMLDNFYTFGTNLLNQTLKQVFEKEKINEICTGFYTTYLEARFEKHYKDLCPNVVLGADHKKTVHDSLDEFL